MADALAAQPCIPAWEISDPAFETDGVRHLTVYSPSLRGRGDISLWVPGPGGLDRPPVILVLLHGVYGSHWAWFGKAGAHRTARHLVEDGQIGPVVLACPSDGLRGDGTAYLDQAGLAAETWVVRDVLGAVRAALGPDLGTGPAAIAGLSMGGYGAIRLGVRHPDIFRAAAGHSSITRLADLAAYVRRLPKLGPVSDPVDLADAVVQAKGRHPALRLDCGTGDPLLAANRDLHARLVASSIDHEYAEHTGGHNWDYWAVHLEDTLRFVDRQSDPPSSQD